MVDMVWMRFRIMAATFDGDCALFSCACIVPPRLTARFTRIPARTTSVPRRAINCDTVPSLIWVCPLGRRGGTYRHVVREEHGGSLRHTDLVVRESAIPFSASASDC